MQLLSDVLKVYLGVDVKVGFHLFWLNVLLDIVLKAFTELRDISPLQCEPCGVGVTTKVDEQVSAVLDGRIDVESRHASGRTGSQVAVAG